MEIVDFGLTMAICLFVFVPGVIYDFFVTGAIPRVHIIFENKAPVLLILEKKEPTNIIARKYNARAQTKLDINLSEVEKSWESLLQIDPSNLEAIIPTNNSISDNDTNSSITDTNGLRFSPSTV